MALVLYGLLNAAAYCCLLPLWEGWDEGYHYGYVQQLSVKRTFPVLRQTDLTREIWNAYLTVPVSNYIQAFTGAPLNFSDYDNLDVSDRMRMRQQLESIDPRLRFESQPGKWNNEAHQAPIPYLWMAPIDWLLRDAPLITRILGLRLWIATAAVVLTAIGARLLAVEMGMPERAGLVALFWVYSSQMFYANSCHICNDWLCVPEMAFLLVAALRAWKTGAGWFWMGLAYSVAVLTKAHFLAVTPLVFGLPAMAGWSRRSRLISSAWLLAPVVALAAPWYARNLILYNNLTGMVEATGGLGLPDYWTAATTMPWMNTMTSMAHGSLWTGNNSFTSFSAATLNVILVLLFIGAGRFISTVHRNRTAAWIVILAIVFYAAGLAFTAVAFYASSKGGLIAPMPWYAQVLLIPIALISIAGMLEIRSPWGWLCASALTMVWNYVMAATFFLKLIPLYGGWGPGRTRITALANWYASSGALRDSFLKTSSPASPLVIWILVIAASGSGLLLTIALVRRGLRDGS